MRISSSVSAYTLLGSSFLLSILAAACSGSDDAATSTSDGGTKDGAVVGGDDDGDSGPTTTYTVGGTITGLTAAGLTLKNNGSDEIAIAASSIVFTFSTPAADGTGYNVTVGTQPTGLTCTVANGSGTVSGADVVSVNVACAPASVNMWTWIGGSKATGAAAVYGTQAIGDAANTPGARYASASWIGADNSLWFFGGKASNGADANLKNDLWKFDGTKWTWITGAKTTDNAGVYGTKGTAAAPNTPGARQFSGSWKDAAGKMWLFGGRGRDGANTVGYLSDVWSTDGAQWTWVAGTNTVGTAAVYGTKGIAATANTPGGRFRAVTSSDGATGAWVFGGVTAANTMQSDLWKFDGANWTWVAGPNTANSKGTYGTKGVADAANVPGARQDATAWTDSQGYLWVFGGYGYDSAGTVGELNDLWKFGNGMWTWVGGGNTVNAVANYGILGVTSAANDPGGRADARGWIDATGNLWLVGGTTQDDKNELNDLWKFDGTNWTWVSGANTPNGLGVYGTVGVAGATAFGARDSVTLWVDSTGTAWFYGGWGFGETGAAAILGDLWKYQP